VCLGALCLPGNDPAVLSSNYMSNLPPLHPTWQTYTAHAFDAQGIPTSCTVCHERFLSRSQLFGHLRTTRCGNHDPTAPPSATESDVNDPQVRAHLNVLRPLLRPLGRYNTGVLGCEMHCLAGWCMVALLLWYCFGTALVPLWYFFGTSLVLLWYYLKHLLHVSLHLPLR
jgi:hypothetical protein